MMGWMADGADGKEVVADHNNNNCLVFKDQQQFNLF